MRLGIPFDHREEEVVPKLVHTFDELGAMSIVALGARNHSLV